MGKSIGLVLANVPGYSETFFVSKICGLEKAGFKIYLLARCKGVGADISYLPKSVKIIEPFNISKNGFFQLIKTIWILSRLYIKSNKAIRRFVALEKADGVSHIEIVRSLYINAHILSLHLDWLHFGFATMGIRRENVARAIGARAAVSFRGYDISRYPLVHPECYQKLFSRIDKVHAISDYLYHSALSIGLNPSIEYVKITPAIDVERFSPSNIELGNDLLRLVSVGRLHWVKGFEYALLALSMLKIDFVYTIVGEGPERERLMFDAYQLGIADKVRFVGKQPHGCVVNYMNQSHIYLQTSVQEGFCNAVLEAQAAGLVCVVSDAEGLPENVVNGKSGFVVEKRNSQAIADKIQIIANMSQDDRDKITTFAVNRIRREFNIRDQIEKFVQFYI